MSRKLVLRRRLPIITNWQRYPMTIGAVTTAPTKATTTTFDHAYWRRIGDSIEITYTYGHTDSTGAAAGSGTYLYPLPSGLTIASNKIVISTTIGEGICGDCGYHDGTAGPYFVGYVKCFNTTNLALVWVSQNDTPLFNGSTSGQLGFNASQRMSFRATVPIAAWTA